MKTIACPSMRDFDALIKKARQQAKSTGMSSSDISRIIAEVRESKGRAKIKNISPDFPPLSLDEGNYSSRFSWIK